MLFALVYLVLRRVVVSIAGSSNEQMDTEVERLLVVRGLLRLDLAEVTPAQGTRRGAELLGPDRRRRRTPCIARTAWLRAS